MTQLISSNQTTDVIAGLSDEIVVFQGVTLYGTPAIEEASSDTFNVDIYVDGVIYGELNAIRLESSADGTPGGSASHSITVGSQGAIRSLVNDAIILWGFNNNIQNNGEITTDSEAAIFNNGGGGNFDNSGYIYGDIGFEIDSSTSTAPTSISNTGEIRGDASGIEMTGGRLYLWNDGTIANSARTSFAAAIETDSTSTQEIVNSGTIRSAWDAIEMLGTSSDTVINTGLIVGDVLLGDGADTFDGRGGTVQGSVQGGDGSDLYIVDDASLVIVETPTGGSDRVQSTVDFRLPSFVERLDLIGQGDMRGEGNELDNLIISGLGDDTLSGGQGNDTLFGSFGADLLIGGEGSDYAAYSNSAGWVNVSLLTGFVGGGAGSHAIGDTFLSIENVSGSQFDDRLNGDNGANILRGEDGDDILRGRGGPDELVGGSGSDTADYADSPDFVNVSLLSGFAGGGGGSHAIGDTWNSIENFTGSNFADRLNGDNLDNILEGRAGADTLDGNGGSDTASYASSSSFVNVSLLTGFTGGGAGSHATGDVLEDIENLIGSEHDDLLNGDNFNNVLEGGAGNDFLRGNNGVDTFVFADGFGNDTVADFVNGAELLDFSGHSAVNAITDLVIGSSGGNAVISDGFGNTIVVNGAAGLIDAGDFIF